MLWIGLGLVVVIFVVWFFLKRSAKEKVIVAKVTNKKATPHQQRGGEDASMPTDYVVSFQADGKKLELVVNHSFYDSVQVGAQGKLTHKGDVFVDFETDDPRAHR